MDIGARIKLIREKAGKGDKKITQAELGDIIGVSRDVVANFENGRVKPDEQSIKLICSELKVNRRWLETGEGKMLNLASKEHEIMRFATQITHKNESELDQFRINLISALAKLDESEWETLAKIIDKLANK